MGIDDHLAEQYRMEPGAAAKPPQSSSRSSNQQQPESYKPAGTRTRICWLFHVPDEQNLGSTTEYMLKKYLLMLATLVATVTYAAGLNPPGGSWLEDSPSPGGRRIAGDSILREINFNRYIVFYCFNAIAFAASLLLSLLLLFLHKDGGNTNLLLMLAVMLVDGLGLTGAYAAGGSHDRFTTVCAAVLVFGVSLYAVVAFLTYFARHPPGTGR